MTGLTGAVLALVLQAGSTEAPLAWTWTLYEGEGPVVLANEIPDTTRLRSTLECQPGSSVVRLSLYGAAPETGFAQLTAGAASAAVEVEPGRAEGLRLALRADHPVFAAFVADGALALTLNGERHALDVRRPHLAKLRRFAELCTG